MEKAFSVGTLLAVCGLVVVHGLDYRYLDKRSFAVCDEIHSYHCDDNTCIPASYHCNSIDDCPNGEDEKNCSSPWRDTFKCSNGLIIPGSDVCDAWNDCANGEDEKNCQAQSCAADRFTCVDDGNCISLSYKCDNLTDCPDKSDERNCRPCASNEFTCNNTVCVHGFFYCDGIDDCGDNSDELNCKCPDRHFKCKSGACMGNVFKCDSKNDCGDNSDEENCPEIHLGTTPPGA